MSGGIYSPLVIWLMPPIFMAGTLSGTRFATFIGALSFIYIVLTAFLTGNEIFINEFTAKTPLFVLTVMSSACGIVLIGYFSNTASRERIKAHEQIIHYTKLASLGEMAAGIGHEINNPLAICVGNITSIDRELRGDDFARKVVVERLEKVKDGHERIRKIVDGLRTYARSDAVESEVFSVKVAIDQTVNLVSEIYEHEGVSVIQDNAAVDFFTKGNLGKFQQVVMNLISNAKDATEGQNKREIHLSLKRDDDKIILSVKDNGSGIPDAIRDKILNPFFTTKGVGKGTGMGLGIVSEIVKSMGGELKIKSVENEGSTFSIVMPIEYSEQMVDQQQQQQDEPHIGLKGVALVVDDEEGIRELLVEHLEDLGLEVEQADDGDNALELVKKKRYDYICTDMKMKRMQGIDFIKEARKLPHGDTGIFIITGGVTTNYNEDNQVNLAKIADGYIMKPFSEDTIYEVLSKYKPS